MTSQVNKVVKIYTVISLSQTCHKLVSVLCGNLSSPSQKFVLKSYNWHFHDWSLTSQLMILGHFFTNKICRPDLGRKRNFTYSLCKIFCRYGQNGPTPLPQSQISTYLPSKLSREWRSKIRYILNFPTHRWQSKRAGISRTKSFVLYSFFYT